MAQAFTEEKRREWQERMRLQQESGKSMLRWCREQQVSGSATYVL